MTVKQNVKSPLCLHQTECTYLSSCIFSLILCRLFYLSHVALQKHLVYFKLYNGNGIKQWQIQDFPEETKCNNT